MSLSARELSQLKKIVALAQSLIAKAEAAPAQSKVAAKAGAKSDAKAGAKAEAKSGAKRTRRSGKDLAAFRKMLKAERKRGVSVTDLAKEHGISAAYIYAL